MRLASDDRLIERVRDGDGRAFEAIYDRYGGDLLRFGAYMLGSPHDAEDAVQASFTSAYEALMADRRPVSLRPWLFTITRNECVSILRGRRPATELNGEVALTDDPVRRLEVREEVRQMLAGIADLPERQRAALVLAEAHGLPHPEIAAVLGVRTEQVKAFVYQARTNLLADRSARETACEEIRRELAEARGHVFLRGRLRRHLRACPGCSEYAEQLSRQRRALGAVLPMIPSLALKHRALEGALGLGGLGTGGDVGGALFGTSIARLAEVADGLNALVLKVAVGAVALTATAGVGASVLGSSHTPPRRAGKARLATGATQLASIGRPSSRPAVLRPGAAAPARPERRRLAARGSRPTAPPTIRVVEQQPRFAAATQGAVARSGENTPAKAPAASRGQETHSASRSSEAERQKQTTEREAAREHREHEHEQREAKHEEHGPPPAVGEVHGKSEEHRAEGVAKGQPSEEERAQKQEAHETKQEEHKPEQPPKK